MAFVLAASAAAQDPAKLLRIDTEAPIHAGTFYAATGEFVPATQGQTSSFSRGTSEVVYNNNHFTAVFYDINDDTLVVDEGRVPSLSSPTTVSPVSITGTSNSYRISDIQFAYATDSIGMGNARIGIYNQYDSCTAPEANGAPILDLIVTGLPGTISPGSVTPFTFDVDMTGFEFCMLADGDGSYDGESSDRFGWALTLSADPGSVIGPIIGARPGAFAPTGDGTTFQNPGAASGSGLSTLDQWFDRDLAVGDNCFNEGGYDPIDGNPAFGSFWLVLGADLDASCASCAMRIDDNFEQNDTCATAVPLAPGVYTGLVVEDQATDPDFYRITVPPGSSVDVTATFLNVLGDVDLNAFTGACGGLIAASAGLGDSESLTVFNCGPTPADFVLEAFVFGSGCNGYELVVDVVDGCGAMDDALEENDSCPDAVPISEGLTANLRISLCDLDYYSIVLNNGESLDVTMTLDNSVADLDLFLFLDDATCDTNPGVLASSTSVTGMENVMLLNDTGQTQTYILRVDVFPAGTTADCATYDLNFEMNGGTEIGDTFCFAELNSTGAGAHIFLTGSPTVSMNDLTLNAQFLPTNSSGFFITSMGQVFVPNPGGSQGNLCIASPGIGRFNADIQNTGAGSMVSFTPDQTMWPQPSTFIVVLPGDTWNFQYWYRDVNPGPTSNFTDAVQLTFD